jgi:hypothetical protein
VGSCFASTQDWGFLQLDISNFQRRLQWLDVVSTSIQGPTSCDAKDLNINIAICVGPHFRAGGLTMNLGVVGAVELLQELAVSSEGSDDFFSFGDC